MLRTNNANWLTHLYGISIVIAFVIPHTSVLFLMINPIICLFFYYLKEKTLVYRLGWIVILSISFSLFVNVPSGIDTKAYLTAATIILYIFCFPFVGNIKPKNSYFYITFFIIFVSQITYLIRIPLLTNLLNTLYPISASDFTSMQYMEANIASQNLLDFRMGGLYRNANDCARSLNIIMTTFIVWNYKQKAIKVFPFLFFTLYAIIITGSRTGLGIAIASLFFYFFYNNSIPLKIKYLLIISTFIGAIYTINRVGNSIRGLNIEEGIDVSLWTKMTTFLYYINHEDSIFKFLFGYADNTKFPMIYEGNNVMKNFDSDYGNIIFCYGFFGFFVIVLYLFSLFRHLNGQGKVFFLSTIWAISNSFVFSYRAFFLFMLLLSPIYTEFQRDKVHNRNRENLH